jgi:ribonuclease PH
VGLVAGEVRVDLAYAEDRDAAVDANVVMRAPAEFVELQGTGEQGVFSREQLEQLVDAAEAGIAALFEAQRRALGW